MNIYTRVLAVGLVVSLWLAAGSVRAGGADLPKDCLVNAEDLSFLSIGLGWEKGKRSLDGDLYDKQIMESRDLFATLTIDVFPWLTIVGGGGETEVKPAPQMAYLDQKPMWLGGIRFNLLEHEILKPAFLESVFRMQAQGTMTGHDGTYQGEDVEWTETRVALLGRMEVFPEQWTIDREEEPFSADFFVGSVFSEIDGDYLPTGDGSIANADFTETDDVGLLLGVDVNIAPQFSVGYEARIFENGTHNVNAAFHF
jgi:hypothetical protein